VVRFRRVTNEDIEIVGRALREADRLEVEASSGEVIPALYETVQKSDVAWTVDDGGPVGLFGVVPQGILGGGAPWFVGTEGLSRHKKEFLVTSKHLAKEFLAEYHYLENYVDERNAASIRWLGWLGFKFDEARPYGALGLKFHRFWMGGW